MSTDPQDPGIAAARKLLADTKTQRDLVRTLGRASTGAQATIGPLGASAAALGDVDQNLQLLRTQPVHEQPFDRLAKTLARPEYAAGIRRSLAEAERAAERARVEREEAMVGALQGLYKAAVDLSRRDVERDRREAKRDRRAKLMLVIAALTLVAAVIAAVVAIVALHH